MRHAIVLAVGLAVLAAGTAPARAQTAAPGATPALTTPALTTGVLGEFCAARGGDTASATAAGYCRGFLIAAGQYHAELTSSRGDRPAIFCLADASPTIEGAQASFAAWTQANPQHAGEKALIGLMRWAAATYPCPAAPRTAAPRR